MVSCGEARPGRAAQFHSLQGLGAVRDGEQEGDVALFNTSRKSELLKPVWGRSEEPRKGRKEQGQ